MNDQHEIIIGNRQNWGGPVPFGISAIDRRQHIYVIGKTGSGKTTLLRNIIVQDINQGRGVAVIDPHGDLAEDLLRQIPRSRTGYVLYFNPSDLEFPVAMNLLANVPKDARPLVASGIVGAFKGIWRDSWGPRMEYILYNAVAALLDCQNVSLLGVNRMLAEDKYRKWVARQVKDPFIKAYWEHEFAGYDERFRREAVAPIQNKLGQFLLTPLIRNILGQVKCKIDFSFMMENARLFVANLSKGKIGHDKANLLGSLLVTQFQLAAMRRAGQPENERRDYNLVIDEFFNFTTDAFSSVLAEARKYRLCLTLAHQYVDQLSIEIRQAVFGNVGTIVVFRVGHSDAEVLQKALGNVFAAASLSSLDRYEAVVNLLVNGANPTPFLATMPAPLDAGSVSAGNIISHSRERFAKPRQIVESQLERWIRRKV